MFDTIVAGLADDPGLLDPNVGGSRPNVSRTEQEIAS
jgi:hypothetical protein